ncbi:MAG TPA: F0F1 ATP synthase subunit A [Terriglobia bacterium]|nr:F0F1 ATP synthase subunit A [Terriglobia bacterium]
MGHDLWFTAILNKLFGHAVAALLVAISYLPHMAFARPADPVHPIPDYVAGEILVLLIIVVGAIILRTRLSMEHPGKFQMAMEVYLEFSRNLVDEVVGHGGRRYVAMVGTLGLFILLCNLEGLVPTLITPTATVYVPLGCAVAAFLHYNFHGFRVKGIFGYLRHLSGPMLAIAWLFFPIEVFSNFLRMLSLTARLWGNMLASVTVPGLFMSLGLNFYGYLVHAGYVILSPVGLLIAVLAPVIFMALHVFEALLQAYVFMILPALYISLATSEEH